jgi:hypothetical protein
MSQTANQVFEIGSLVNGHNLSRQVAVRVSVKVGSTDVSLSEFSHFYLGLAESVRKVNTLSVVLPQKGGRVAVKNR